MQQIVELGPEAQGLSLAERARLANAALELIVLAGFGGALPREFSGGMRQRVGIARALVEEVYALMTQRPEVAAAAGAPPALELGYRLPDADISRLESVLELIASEPFNGQADLPHLAEESERPDEVLFPIYEAFGLLGFTQVIEGDIRLTRQGRILHGSPGVAPGPFTR